MNATKTKKPANHHPSAAMLEIDTAMGCYPGCRCVCNGMSCACREGKPSIVEPSASERANGARVIARKVIR